jgi:hypothetical protein
VKLAKVRISGDEIAITGVLTALVAAARAAGFEIPEQSGLYPNRRDPGYRAYLTLALPEGTDTDRAGRRTAAKQSAAPLPQPRRHLP